MVKLNEDATNEDLAEALRHLSHEFLKAAEYAHTKAERQALMRAGAQLRLTAAMNNFGEGSHEELIAWYEAARLTLLRVIHEERANRRMNEMSNA